MPPIRALLVEDSEDDAALLVRELQGAGYEVAWKRVQAAGTMREALGESWDVVFADYNMPGFSAPAALAVLKESGIDIPFLIVSGSVGEEVAAAAMRAGAHDYVLKGNLRRLSPAVERELEQASQRRARRNAEDQLRQSQKMEAIGQLAGGVAHDFNNLLTAILGYADLLVPRLAGNPEGLEEVEEIRKAGERAAALTRQLLAFSRRQVLERRILNLNAIVAEMETMLRRLIGTDIDFVTRLDPSLGPVLADQSQIEQVVMNLVVNSRDAMPQGGKLTIETSNVDLDEAYAGQHAGVRPGAYVRLTVSDDGAGMDERTRSRIFEPFFTTKPKDKGTGLGLSTVYGIVKQSGGNIWVYSEPGRGTTLKIHLPRAEGAVDVAQAPIAASTAQAEGTILLVEDNLAVRKLTRKMLQEIGYKILEAESGVEALRLAAEHPGPIELVLTDVIMPEMSGAKLAARLRKLRPATRFLFMSGYSDEAIVRHDMLRPGAAFLQKPFTLKSLAKRVREVLAGPV